ncbi:MAG: hypothetical protein ACI92O_000449 [Colwellia sp.]|jgi:hypothetical protein
MENINNNCVKIHNHFGQLYLTPITAFMPVKEISLSKCPLAKHYLISFDIAAKVALITGNRNIQICFPLANTSKDDAYVVYHNTQNTAAVCAVEIMNFVTESDLSAVDTINNLALKAHGPLRHF